MNIKKLAAVLFAAAATMGAVAANYAWPANYGGVMLQGFYWDSYADTKWTKLTEQVDELSASFDLIWVPNSAQASGSPTMGYMPIYWFTHHNSSFGTASELRKMIAAFKEKGTGIIADVVVNHRVGVSNWYNFPSETWNGQTWSIGLDGICRTDELNGSGHGTPTGAADTGDDFAGARDLDHTNANVQNNVKNYCKCLLEEWGYTGFRYDMAKGYAGKYTKMYNEYAKPQFSVGEYWDGSYDALAAWIESTGRQSAAFDFACKYAMNEAFGSNDMTKLVWKANGTTNQPAGLIHYGYPQYAVTFIDNHDTYRDGSKFTGNVLAANAFILCSPGTPCVFLPHWKQYKSSIQALIAVRKACGVHNQSTVTVLKSSRDCYMAEVKGTKGTLVVRIGSATDTPAGYTTGDIKASGNGYCVWSKQGSSQGGGETIDMPSKLYLMGHIKQGAWVTNAGITMTKSGNTFRADNVEFVASPDGNVSYFAFVTAIGTTGNSSEWDAIINANDRFGATSKDAAVTIGQAHPMKRFYANADASGAFSWKVNTDKYDVVADFKAMTMTVSKTTGIAAPEVDTDADAPAEYYTLQGVRVAEPTAGIYLQRRNGKVSKIIIK